MTSREINQVIKAANGEEKLRFPNSADLSTLADQFDVDVRRWGGLKEFVKKRGRTLYSGAERAG
jgi:hypothetical protein